MTSLYPSASKGEVHTPYYCVHPYYGFVCRPNATLDFSEKVPASFGHGAEAVVDAEGFRNDDCWPAVKARGEIWIGLFGGSVAFSVASTNNATTISAFLERELNARCSVGEARRIRVRNFALPAGQQPQQAIIFMMHAAELDGVITFDGVNDAIIGPYYNRHEIPDNFPWKPVYEVLCGRNVTHEQNALSWAIEDAESWDHGWPRVLRGAIRAVARRRIVQLRQRLQQLERSDDIFRSIFPSDGDSDHQRWTQVGVTRWSSMIQSMKAICDARRIDALFILQPVPERHKVLTPSERHEIHAYPDMVDLRQAAYPLLLKTVDTLALSGVQSVSFDEVFRAYTQTIYTDHIHFEDRGCEIVARRMADIITDGWRCLRS